MNPHSGVPSEERKMLTRIFEQIFAIPLHYDDQVVHLRCGPSSRDTEMGRQKTCAPSHRRCGSTLDPHSQGCWRHVMVRVWYLADSRRQHLVGASIPGARFGRTAFCRFFPSLIRDQAAIVDNDGDGPSSAVHPKSISRDQEGCPYRAIIFPM